MELQLVTATTGEPVTVAEMKTHMRVTHDVDDTLIGSQITAARIQVEAETGRQLCQATYDLKLDAFPTGCGQRERAIKCPRAPLQSVTSITYTADDGTSTVLGSSAYDVLTSWSTAPDPLCPPGRIYEAYNETWPTTRLKGGAVVVRYVAGYGTASAVPELVKAAVKLIAAHLYENREETVTGTIIEIPRGAERCIDLLKTGEL